MFDGLRKLRSDGHPLNFPDSNSKSILAVAVAVVQQVVSFVVANHTGIADHLAVPTATLRPKSPLLIATRPFAPIAGDSGADAIAFAARGEPHAELAVFPDHAWPGKGIFTGRRKSNGRFGIAQPIQAV